MFRQFLKTAARSLREDFSRLSPASSQVQKEEVGTSFPVSQSSPGLLGMFGGGGLTASGQTVNTSSALTLSAVFACVIVISEDIAKIPASIYRRKGRKEVTAHPHWRLLNLQPCSWLTRFEWRQMLAAYLVLTGNAYAFKHFGPDGEILELFPLPSNLMSIYTTPSGEIFYSFNPHDDFYRGKLAYMRSQFGTLIPGRYILHLRDLTLNGLTGISRMHYARESIGAGLAMQEHGNRVFSQGARPGGVLEHPEHLSEEAGERLRRRFDSIYAGAHNAWKTMILEEGMKWRALTMNNNDSQWIQSRQLNVLDIARIFRVPPHKIGAQGDKQTYQNIEQANQDYINDALVPTLERIEDRFTLDLLSESEQRRLLVEHDFRRFLRADSQARATFYQSGRQWGWLTANDIRAWENLGPTGDEHGDQYWRPLNMVPADTPAEGADNESTNDSDNDGDGENDPPAESETGFPLR